MTSYSAGMSSGAAKSSSSSSMYSKSYSSSADNKAMETKLGSLTHADYSKEKSYAGIVSGGSKDAYNKDLMISQSAKAYELNDSLRSSLTDKDEMYREMVNSSTNVSSPSVRYQTSGMVISSQYVEEELRKEIREKDFVIDSMRSEKTRFLAENETLRRRITDIEMEHQRTIAFSMERFTESNSKELKEKAFMIQQLREEKIKIEVEVQSLRQEMALMKTQAERSISVELHSHTERHRQEMMEIEHQLMHVRAEKASLEKQVEALRTEITYTKSEQDKFVLIQVESQKEESKREVREKEYLIGQLRSEKGSLEGQIESLRRQITYVEVEKEKNMSIFVESQTKGLKNEINQKEVIIEQLRTERARFEETITSLRREIVVAREEGQKNLTLQIESHSDGYKREIHQKEQMIQQLYAEKATIQSELEKQKREIFVVQSDSEKRISVEVAKQSEVLRSQIVEKESRIHALHADVLKYKTEIESVKREITMMHSKKDVEISVQVERKSETLKKEVMEREITIGRLKDEVNGYLHRISTLEREIESKMTIIHGYTSEIETLRTGRVKLETEMGSLKNEFASLKVGNETKYAIQIQEQTEQHRKELMEKEYLITQLRTEKSSFESQVVSLRQQIIVIESENEKNVSIHVENQAEGYKKEIREKEFLVESMRMERTTFERQIETLRNQITEIKSENEKNIAIYIESNSHGYNKQIEEKEMIIMNLRAERSRYEEQIQSLREQIVEVRSESEKSVAIQIESRTTGFRNEINQKETMIQHLYEEKSKLQTEIENQRREMIVIQSNSQKNVTVEVEKRVEIYRSEISQKETVITQQRSEIMKLHGEIESIKKEMTMFHSHKDHEVRIQVQSQTESLRKEVMERDASIENLKIEIMSYRTQVESLKREAEYKFSAVQGYTTEIETLRADREKIEFENRSLRNEMVVVRSEAEKKVAIQIQSNTESNRKELMEKEYMISQLRQEKSVFEKQIESLKQEILVVRRESETSLTYQVESRTEHFQRELRQKEYLIEQLRTEKLSIERSVESLREQIVLIKSDYEKRVQEVKYENESKLAIYVESSTVGLKKEVKEKEYLIEQLRMDIARLEERCEAFNMQMITIKQESQRNVSIQIEAQVEGHKKEITEKQTMISQLYSEKSQLQSHIESLKRDIILVREESQRSVTVEVEKRLEVYRREVLEKEELIQQLRSEGYHYHSKIESLKQEIKAVQVRKETELALHMESRVESVKQEVREKEVVISNLTSENVNLRSQIESLRRESEYKVSVVSGYTSEIEKLKSERMTLESRLISLKNEVTSVKSETEKVIMLQFQGQMEYQRKDLMEKESLITQLHVERDNFEKQVESLRSQIVYMEGESERNVSIHVESRTENYKQDIREKEYLIESLRTEKITFERQIESLRSQLIVIKEENQRNISVLLESKTESHRSDLKEKDVMIGQLHGERRQLEERIQMLREEIVKVRSETQNSVNIQIQSHTENFKTEISQKEMLIQGLYAEKTKLQGEIENLRREVIIVRSEGEKNMSTQVEKRVEIYRNEIMEKETVIQQLRSEVFKLQGEVQSVKQEVVNVQSKNEYTINIEVERKVESYRNEIREREIIIGNLRAELNSYQTQIYSLNRDIEYKTSTTHGYVTQIETLRGEKQRLEVEIGSLKNEVLTVKSESDKSMMLHVHSQTESHRKEVMEKEYLITRLREEKASFERQVESLRQQIVVIESENNINMSIQVESQAENYKQDIREKEYLIESLRTEKITFERQVESLRNQIIVIKSENEKSIAVYVESSAERYKKEISEKEFLIESLRSDRAKFENDVENLKHQMILVRSEGEKNVGLQIASHVESYKKEISQKEMVIQELYSEKSKMQSEMESLRYGITMAKNEGQRAVTVEVEKRVEVYRNEVMQKETEIQKLRSDMFKYESEIAFLKQEMKTIEHKNEQNLSFQLEYQSESIKKDAMNREMTIEGLSTEVEALRREQRNSTTVTNGYVVEIERLKKELTHSHHDRFLVESSKKEYESLKLKFDELNREKEMLLKARFDMEQELRLVKEKVMTVELHAKDTSNREIIEYQTKVTDAEQKYYQVLAEKNRIESEDSRYKQEVWQKQELIYSLEKEIRELKTSKESYIKSNEETNMLISELRMKIAALQSEVEKYKKESLFSTSSSKATEVNMLIQSVPKLEFTSPTRSTYSEKSTGFATTSTPRSIHTKSSYDNAAMNLSNSSMVSGVGSAIGRSAGSSKVTFTTSGKSSSAPSSPEKIIIPTTAEFLGTGTGSYQSSSATSGMTNGSSSSAMMSSSASGLKSASYGGGSMSFSGTGTGLVQPFGTSGAGFTSFSSGGTSKGYSSLGTGISQSSSTGMSSSKGFSSLGTGIAHGSSSSSGMTTSKGFSSLGTGIAHGSSSGMSASKGYSSLGTGIAHGSSSSSGMSASMKGYSSSSGGATKKFSSKSTGSSSMSKAGGHSGGYSSFSASGGSSRGFSSTDGAAMSKSSSGFSSKGRSSGRSAMSASSSSGGAFKSSGRSFKGGSAASYQSGGSSKGYSASSSSARAGSSSGRKFY